MQTSPASRCAGHAAVFPSVRICLGRGGEGAPGSDFASAPGSGPVVGVCAHTLCVCLRASELCVCHVSGSLGLYLM